MTSPNQRRANRRNAQESTGPRTAAGKAAVRYNALTHGILAQAVIPQALEPYESREDFDALLATLHQEFAPANAIEELLVEQIATAYWRLARLYRAEAGAIARQQNDLDLVLKKQAGQRYVYASLGPIDEISLLERGIKKMTEAIENPLLLRPNLEYLDKKLADETPQDNLMELAHKKLDQLKQDLSKTHEQQRATEAAERSLPPMDIALKYARYEAALQNQLHRALSSLERLQRLRLGDHVPPPELLDVALDVSGVGPSQDKD